MLQESLKGTRKCDFLSAEKEEIEQRVRSKSHREIQSLKNNVSELRDKLESASNENGGSAEIFKTNSENNNLKKIIYTQEKVENGQIKTQDLVQMQNLYPLELNSPRKLFLHSEKNWKKRK